MKGMHYDKDCPFRKYKLITNYEPANGYTFEMTNQTEAEEHVKYMFNLSGFKWKVIPV